MRRRRRNPGTVRYRVGGRGKALPLAEALAKASAIHRRTGVFASVEAASPSRARRRNPSDEARELELFIVNDGDLYRQNIGPVVKNLAKKMAKGTYKHDLAVKLWLYTAGFGAQKYTKEHGGSGNGSYGSFSPADRKAVAKELADYYLDEVKEAAERISGKSYKSNPHRYRRNSMARRKKSRRRSTARGTRVTFRKGGRHTVVFRRAKASASTKAKRRAAGRRLARMWTRAERMANLRKAWAANRKRGRKHRRVSRR